MTDWNYDVSKAPRDGSPIWAACADLKIYKTWWLPADGKHRPDGRWSGLGTKQVPLAWTVLKHPLVP